jgi:hypothetical protein
MTLQFNPPPEWLMREYLDRKQPAEQVSEGIQTALNNYLAIDQAKRRNALAESEGKRQEKELAMKQREQFFNYGDVASLPQGQQQELLTPAQGPVSESGVAPSKSPIVQHFEQFLKQNPEGIKGREKKQNNRPQQAPFLINNKPAVFRPESSDYAIAPVVDPSTPGPVQDPEFSPRTVQPVSNQFVGVQDGKPVLLDPRTKKMTTGTLPGQGPLTSTTQSDGQANAKLYSDRMDIADQQINQLGQSTDLTSAKSGIQGLLPNVAKSANIQGFEQAKRNFLNATLRRESGAAISQSEMTDGNKQYFPVFGDSPEVLKQKALNRSTAIDGIRNAGGLGPRGKQQPTQNPTGMEHLSDEELQRIANGG